MSVMQMSLKALICEKFPMRIYLAQKLTRILKTARIAPTGSKLQFTLSAFRYKLTLDFLSKEFKDLIGKYKNKNDHNQEEPGQSGKSKGKIWTMWWQGEENAPPIVKRCIESMRRNAGGHKVVVITERNISEYIDLPDYVYEKHEAKLMRVVFLSDIIRYSLLAEHGGLWLDATIYCFRPIPEEIWAMPLHSSKHYNKIPFPNQCGAKDKYIRNFESNELGGHKGHPAYCFARDLLIQYWKDRSFVVEYYLMDCAMKLAYDNIDAVKRDVDAIPINSNDRFELRKIMNKAYNQEEIDKIANSGTVFFKLCCKEKFKKRTRTGTETTYKRFIDETMTYTIKGKNSEKI
ncbi:MAG: capsular polysaccharide synthesis protein [Oscillospiraceae bacterium]|nr:capsular polysaccharide synthesis protein [Oscillospiraceae bacterium]